MLSKRSRVVVPFAVTGIIAAGALIPTLGAAATPNLPAITAPQLVAKVLGERVSHLSGTFQWRADLGLPSLSALTGGGQGPPSSSGFDETSLLSGTHTFNVWVDGRLDRLAAPGQLSETDLVRRGDQAWLYDSSTNHVTHYRLAGAGPGPAGPPSGEPSVTALADELVTQARAARTDVSVARPVEVAGHAAYVLRLAPERVAANRGSTVSSVTIAVDAKNGLPLRVSIYAVGQSSPALRVGYSSVRFATPKASIFAIPKGETTSTKVIHPSHPASPGSGGQAGSTLTSGRDWGAIVDLPSGAATSSAASGELDAITTVVSGSWGSGRLLRSTLANALFLDNGRVLVGLVTPEALEAAAGRLLP